MARKVSLGAAISFAAVVSAVTVSVTYVYAMNVFNTKVADVNQRQAMYTKLSEIDQKTRQDYIGQIEESVLNDGICAGYIAGLSDPDARYLSAERYQSYLSGSQNKTIGVGIRTIQDEDGNMEIIEVFPKSAAEYAGIQKGDVITAIDGREVVRLTYGEAVTHLDGTAGTAVKFNVLRPSEDGEIQQLEFNIVRAEYSRSLLDSSIINGNVGYIAVSEFQESMLSQFSQILSDMKEQQVCGLVIDLRSNSGGSVEAMAEALDQILPAGNMVMSVDRSGEISAQYISDADEVGVPLSIVVDSTTYGAAEIFAADVKDYGKGMLVGGTTAGYGVQTEALPLSDGSAVILPTARYVRVDGTEINRTGVTPDIQILLNDTQKKQFERENLPIAEDPQIQAAVTALIRQGADVSVVPGTSQAADSEGSENPSGMESAEGSSSGTSSDTQSGESGSETEDSSTES